MRFFSKRFFAIFLAGVILLTTSNATSAQAASGPWSLEDCLEYGLSHHPDIAQAESQVRSSAAREGQARAGLGTKVNFQSSFQRSGQDFSRRGSLNSGLTDSTANSISARKVLDDSGRTREQMNAARETIKANQAQLSWYRVLVASGIKTAYYRALQAKALMKVQEDALKGFQAHLQKVNSFVEVGSKPPHDITKAEVDVANTQVSLIKAENNYRNALARLAEEVGFEGELTINNPDVLSKIPMPSLEKDRLLEEAFGRNDVAYAGFNLRATEHQLGQVKKGLKPNLSSSAGYDWSGTATPLDRSWNMGLAVSVPILDGKLTRFQVREAEANIQTSKARLNKLRQTVRSQVEVAINGVNDAFKRLEASEVLLRQASESLALAEGRYDAGLGSPIEITDARSAFSNAEGTKISAYFDSLIAISELEKSLGRLPNE